MTDSTPQRRPFTGSCHCGATRFVTFITLPHDPPYTTSACQAIYRCNCTICHKAGILHLRLPSAPDDFLLLAPLDPFTQLGDYQCDAKQLHFFFCRTCGTRCFSFMGQGERVDFELDALGAGSGIVKAWRPKKQGWFEGKRAHGCYLSVNAHALDQGQTDLDLREWQEKKWICYLDFLKSGEQDQGQPTYERPFPGGTY